MSEYYVFAESVPDNKILLYWRYKPTNENLADHSITIYKKIRETSDLKMIAEFPATQTTFLDTEQEFDYYKVPIYIVMIDKKISSGEIQIAEKSSIEGVNIRMNVDIHVKFSGTPALIYCMIQKGDRCKCWDPIRKTYTSTSCTSCYATGYVGGYYSPILTQVAFSTPKKSNQPGDTLAQQQTCSILMSRYPVINPRDVIVDTIRGSRWRVQDVAPSEDYAGIIHQEATLVRLNPTDIEMKIPLVSGLIPVIEPRPEPYYYCPDIRKGT